MIDKGDYFQWYEKGHYESETRAWKDRVSGTICTTPKTKYASGGGR